MTEEGYPSEVERPLPTSEALNKIDQLWGEMQSAGDSMSLMAVVSKAESFPGISKNSVLQHAHENAVRLQDKEVALMYGNRLAAQMMAEAVQSMHGAVTGMIDSASQHKTAAGEMYASADLIHRASFRS